MQEFRTLGVPGLWKCVRALPDPWPEAQPRYGARVVDAPGQHGAPEESIKIERDTASRRTRNTPHEWVHPAEYARAKRPIELHSKERSDRG
jgi:hypothetical protein